MRKVDDYHLCRIRRYTFEKEMKSSHHRFRRNLISIHFLSLSRSPLLLSPAERTPNLQTITHAPHHPPNQTHSPAGAATNHHHVILSYITYLVIARLWTTCIILWDAQNTRPKRTEHKRFKGLWRKYSKRGGNEISGVNVMARMLCCALSTHP